MKFRARKIFKIGKIKTMIAGGISRRGQLYGYGGIKTKKGYSAGASIGTEGKQFYLSKNKGQNQIRIKHNSTMGDTQLRLKKPHY